jgi:aminoglycoside phosphotransferase (APT) family kinase protein
MNTWMDQTRAVRPGEELDAARLQEYLRAQLDQPGAELVIEQFPGGFSNLTYLLRFGDREYVLRRPPHGSRARSAHDMGREFRVLSRLAPVFDRAPRPVLFCDDSAVIGAEFYLMERIRGVIIRRDPPPGLTIDEGTAARLSEALVDTLAMLHGIDYAAAGLSDLGRPEGYVERQITGWIGRYQAAQTDALPAMDEVGAWLAAHMPIGSPAALIHNDFKFDNMILDPADITRVIGILDWEMSTIGDPLMDLGTSLSYWVERDDSPALQEIRFVPTTLPGMMTRAELVLRYAEKSGRDVADILFYYVYGLFKLAVVAQQIYYRFVQGSTRDERFGRMIDGVRAMSAQARAVLDRGKI